MYPHSHKMRTYLPAYHMSRCHSGPLLLLPVRFRPFCQLYLRMTDQIWTLKELLFLPFPLPASVYLSVSHTIRSA